MAQQFKSPSATITIATLARGLSLLALALGLALPVYAWFGWVRWGNMGVRLAVVAAVVCWVGCSLAYLFTFSLRSSSPVGGALGGMFFRMGLPVVATISLGQAFEGLSVASVGGMILAYYFLGLIVETLLAVRLVRLATVSDTKAS